MQHEVCVRLPHVLSHHVSFEGEGSLQQMLMLPGADQLQGCQMVR